MSDTFRRIVAGQYGAAFGMLENAIRSCPDALWATGARDRAFGYLVYHTIFWHEFYLAEAPDGFVPKAPFDLGEMDPAGVYPDPLPAKAELLAALDRARNAMFAKVAALTDAQLDEPSVFARIGITRGEMLLYDMRHVQHHTAQLNWILRDHGIEPPKWVRTAPRT